MEQKLRMIWWGLLCLFLIAASVKFLLPVRSPAAIEVNQTSGGIVVYVTGAVKKPGLLELPLDARLDDALKAAEPSVNADLDILNPAQRLKDGQKIIVPYKLQNSPDALEASVISPSISVGNAAAAQPGQIKININTADANLLEDIPGIGPALAQRIIDYRQQYGLFSSPEEIQNVSGIGPKTYENMASYITVGP